LQVAPFTFTYIAIDGTDEALPKHSIWFNPNVEKIRVKVLSPVDTTNYELNQARMLQRQVRARIVEQVAAWRGLSPEAVDALHDTDAAATDWLDESPTTASEDTLPQGEASVKPSTQSGSSEPGG